MEEIGKIYEIQIEKGREHRAVLTPNRVNSPKEFFYNAYQDAKYQLQEIVLASYRSKKRESEELTTKRRIELLHEYPNNVIAFCADRGRGKTTAMLSFSNALEALGSSLENSPQNFWGTLPATEQPVDARFEVMAPIDPASMENTESVLQQIIFVERPSTYLDMNPVAKISIAMPWRTGFRNARKQSTLCTKAKKCRIP